MDMFNFNSGVQDYWERTLAWNAVKNHSWIEKEYADGKPWFDGLPYIGRKIPALILGSGPSLNKAFPLFRHWMGGIFSGASHVRILDHYRRHPEFVCVIDSSESQADKLKGPIYYKTTLVTHPCVEHRVLTEWKGERRYYLPVDLTTDFTMKTLPALYPWISSRVVNSGCVANAMVLIAASMGYDPIITIGVDFGFPGIRERCTNYKQRAPYVHWPEPAGEIDPEGVTEMGSTYEQENDIWTTKTNKFYKMIALANWKAGTYNWIDASEGIVNEVPKMDIEKIVKNQKMNPATGDIIIDGAPERPENVAEIVDGYTVPRGALVLGSGGQVQGIEFPDAMKSRRARLEQELKTIGKKLDKWRWQGDHWEIREKKGESDARRGSK
jgi:hypothetical protein